MRSVEKKVQMAKAWFSIFIQITQFKATKWVGTAMLIPAHPPHSVRKQIPFRRTIPGSGQDLSLEKS